MRRTENCWLVPTTGIVTTGSLKRVLPVPSAWIGSVHPATAPAPAATAVLSMLRREISIEDSFSSVAKVSQTSYHLPMMQVKLGKPFLGRQAFEEPALVNVEAVANAIMQSAATALPEFQFVRND